MSFDVSTSDDLKKYACGEHCQAVLEVTNVKTVNAAKFKKTIIQGRTSDSKYIVITYNKMIRLDLMLGDIAFFMDTVVGRYKDRENHFNYDWELKENSKIRLLKRNGNDIGKDVFPGAPEITPLLNAFNNQKKPSMNETPNPGFVKKETQKPVNTALPKKGPLRSKNKINDSKSLYSVKLPYAKKSVIQGHLEEEFRSERILENGKEKEYFFADVRKIEGELISVMVSKTVMLPLILKKGYLLQLNGNDQQYNGKTTRVIEADSQIIFKGLGRFEEQKDQIKKVPEMRLNPSQPKLHENAKTMEETQILKLSSISSRTPPIPPPRPNSINTNNADTRQNNPSFPDSLPFFGGRQPPHTNWSSK